MRMTGHTSLQTILVGDGGRVPTRQTWKHNDGINTEVRREDRRKVVV